MTDLNIYCSSNRWKSNLLLFFLLLCRSGTRYGFSCCEMKLTALVLCAGLATAFPQGKGGNKPLTTPPAEGKLIPAGSSVQATVNTLRDKNGHLDAGLRPLISNEVTDQTPCGKIIFIFARASQEPTNMVFEFPIWFQR